MRPVLKPKDIHIIVSHAYRTAKAFDAHGLLLWKTAALTEGVADSVDLPGGDTPFGLYRLGEPIPTSVHEPAAIWHAYGPWFMDMQDLENQETGRGRAGIGLHGGGTGLRDPLADEQPLIPTHGCVRVHNGFLKSRIVPLVQRTQKAGGSVYLTVVT